MIKKVSILSFIIVFSLSAIGHPVFAHICTITGERTLFGCESCNEVEKQEVVQETDPCCSSAPEEAIPQSDVVLTLLPSGDECCFDTFDYKKIQDGFSPVFQLKFEAGTLLYSIISDDMLNIQQVKQYILLSENLPPPSFGRSLLYSLHQLKLGSHLS